MNRPPKKNKTRRRSNKSKSAKLPTTGIARFDHFVGDLAWRETRSVKVLTPDAGLPLGDYGFIEFYCADPSCDCRRVILQVWAENLPGQILANIGYGWEDEQFYTDWMHGDAKLAKELKGPGLEPMQPQSHLAEKLLALFKDTVMEDELYLERLKAHYAMAKKIQGAKGY